MPIGNAFTCTVARNRREDQRGRQRNVQKESDALLAAERAQFGGQRDEVVVMHPDHVIVVQQRLELSREKLIHAAVTCEMAGVEIRQIQSVMKHRPQHAVGIAFVVALVVAAIQIDRGQRDLAGTARVQLTFAIGCVVFRDVAAPAEPQPTGLLQRISQCHGEAARSGFARICEAVGDDDETAHQITLLHGLDNAMAALITPTIE